MTDNIELLNINNHFRSMKELQEEIQAIKQEGYDISIGKYEDKAHKDEELINHVFTELENKGKRFQEQRDDITKEDLGLKSLGQVTESQIRKSYVRSENAFKEIRSQLLFDESKMSWHVQRGSALALQTIVDAHELAVNDSIGKAEGDYDTMSGNLTYFDRDFKFNDKDGSLSGMNLEEAIIQTRKKFYGDSEIEADKYTDEALINLHDFLQAPVTEEFKKIVVYCYDALGIRSRKHEVGVAVSNHISKILKNNPEKKDITLFSLGCGTAQAILEIAKDSIDKGLEPQVILLDQDPIALAAAKNLALNMGLSDNIEVHCERLFNRRGQLLDISKILLGRTIDVAEDTGLREYLPDFIYKNLTQSVWGYLSDNGIMTTGNMNLNRPQPEFLHGLMGWRPNVIMRSINAGLKLHEESGIPKGNTKARVTYDGVYTLFFSTK